MTSVIMAVVKAVHGHEGEVTGLVQRTHVQAVQTVQDDTTESDATLLLGLEGLAVEQVELDAEGARVVHVVTDDEAAAGCPSCGMLSTVCEGPRRHQAQGRAVRRSPVAAGVAQASVALPGGGVFSWVVHRIAAGGPGQGQGHDPAAEGVRGRDRDPVLLREGRCGVLRGVLADRARRVRRARRPGPGAAVAAGGGARDR